MQHVPELRWNGFVDEQLRVEGPKAAVLQRQIAGTVFNHGESRVRGGKRAGEGCARGMRVQEPSELGRSVQSQHWLVCVGRCFTRPPPFFQFKASKLIELNLNVENHSSRKYFAEVFFVRV